MLRGISSVNLDAKGRLSIPTRYREELIESCDGQLVATVDKEDRCLLIYPAPDWETVERDLGKLPTSVKGVKELKRFMIGYATECAMDTQGRVLLSEDLRRFAGLSKPVTLIGQLNKFEVWDRARFESSMDEWKTESLDAKSEEVLSTFSY